jgi:hypothetical protein
LTQDVPMGCHVKNPTNASWQNSLLLICTVLLVALSAWTSRAVAENAQAPEDAGRPPPPIVYMPLREVEPPRNVPATQWKSPYCGTWDDGCTECTRKTLDETPVCKPVDHYIGGGTCKLRGIVCERSVNQLPQPKCQRNADNKVICTLGPGPHPDFSELERVCVVFGWVAIPRTFKPNHNHVLAQTYVTGFSYDKRTRRWTNQSELLSYMPFEMQWRMAHRVLSVLGRDPDTEFTISSRNKISTYLCYTAQNSDGAAHLEKPDWFELVNANE